VNKLIKILEMFTFKIECFIGARVCEYVVLNVAIKNVFFFSNLI